MSEEIEQVVQEEQKTPPQAKQEQENHPPNLEALMHVPLVVSVELGRVKIPLHTVVRMGRGTVLKLQKEAEALVDILANGAVFARGEVVKADGKLGVRITDVVPPAERIRALS
jgi:flagellar motor switch protein FliN/FliY